MNELAREQRAMNPQNLWLISFLGFALACSSSSSLGDVPALADGGDRAEVDAAVDAGPSPRLDAGPGYPSACVPALGAPVFAARRPSRIAATFRQALEADVDLEELREGTSAADVVFTAAEAAIARALADPSPLGCAEARADCLFPAVAARVEMLLHRPLVPTELASLEQVLSSAELSSRLDAAGGVLLATAMMPEALYVLEFGGGAGEGPLPAAVQADRVAALFLDGPGDAALRAAVRNAETLEVPALRTQAQRLMMVPGFDAGAVSLHRSWLDYGDDPDLPSILAAETDHFVLETLNGPTPTLEALLTRPYTYWNDELATYYGRPERPGPELTRVELDPTRYASVLTQGSLLAAPSPTGGGNVWRRALRITEQLLCAGVPEPPPGLDFAAIDAVGDTNRERAFNAVSDAPCRGCHLLFDPVGFAFEHFDAAGRYREDDDGFPIDDSWEVTVESPGAGSGPRELAEHIVQSPAAHRCVVRQYLTYGLRRDLTVADECTVTGLSARFERSGADLRDLLVAITETEAFRSARDRTSDAPPLAFFSPFAPGAREALNIAFQRTQELRSFAPADTHPLLKAHMEGLREVEQRLAGMP